MKKQPHSFTVIPNAIINHEHLSYPAKHLYTYLSMVQNGKPLSNAYLAKAMDTSIKSITRWKKELQKVGVMETVKVGQRDFICFLAPTKEQMEEVRKMWGGSPE